VSLLRRGNRRRREPQRSWLPLVPWWRLAGAALAVVLVGLGWFTVRSLLDRPIRAVVVTGEFERVSADRLEAELAHYMGESFLGLDLAAVQAEVAAVPWVATARVSRRWPDALEVAVTEEVPAARWGEAGLLNPSGRLFVTNATHIPAELPRLAGPPGTEGQVAARFVAIREQLVQRGVGVAALELDSRGAWSFQLSNGIRVRLGSAGTDQRLAAFYRAFDQVVAAVADDVAYVDMRYPNGFAIGWKGQRTAGVAVAGGAPDAQEG
jgi:cell division protein FtsQ